MSMQDRNSEHTILVSMEHSFLSPDSKHWLFSLSIWGIAWENDTAVDQPILNEWLRQFDGLNGQLQLLFLMICVWWTGSSEHGSVNQPQSAPSGEL